MSVTTGAGRCEVAADEGPRGRADFHAAVAESSSRGGHRPRVCGKFLFVGHEKLYVRGVTYGAFRPDASGREYTDLERIDTDFAQIAACGLNAVRIPHTTPPPDLLDIAHRHGLWVMVGLSGEQHTGYDPHRRNGPDPDGDLRANVRACAGHPALLCFALGNEIPASVARWLGARRIERYLKRLYEVVKDEDPGAIVTYVNYPTTEYLRLDFLDLLAFNVYLEDVDRFAAYLARLHHRAGDRPLLMSEVGLDSLRNGELEQARSLYRQLRTTFEAGCAGAFVFSWTDEWHRGQQDVHDWAFGLTDRDRRPKPALAAVRAACRDIPFPATHRWPKVSVVVCAYNAGATIADTLEGLADLAYPDYEVIVVNDGSTDSTAEIAGKFDVQLISTPNRGLSRARNTGLWRSAGEIVAYVDADARPDPHWLHYLVATFEEGEFGAVGGPNISPHGDGLLAECISNAPGNPTHVMLADRVAEHIPGCNMAFRRDLLTRLGGFDPRFREAGDDVDICWRLQDAGATIGFSPSAVVWHHRRNSIRAFLRQQVGYGAAEGQLEEKWPHRHNRGGRILWSGQIYGSGHPRWPRRRARIYQGLWGTAPFQSVYERSAGSLGTMAASAEWRLLTGALTIIAGLGLVWIPLLAAAPLAVIAAAVMIIQALIEAAHGNYSSPRRGLRLITAALFIVQPLARLRGRMRTIRRAHSLHLPLALRGIPLLRAKRSAYWSERWREPATWLHEMLEKLWQLGAIVHVGSDYDCWDLHVRGGRLGGARLLAAFEDNGSGNQYLRFRAWPAASRTACVASAALVLVAVAAGLDHILAICALFAAFGSVLAGATAAQCAAAVARLWSVVPNESQSARR
jgi:GT2 family glycosyltransferase